MRLDRRHVLAGTALFGVEAPANSEFEVRKNIAYRSDPEADPIRHRLDLYLPKAGGKFPWLIYVHGGGWSKGSKDLYARLGETFAVQGIGTAVINYRLTPQVMHPEHARDASRAVAWLHRNSDALGGDKTRIHLCGHSAGAHLSALIALDPRYLTAVGLAPSVLRGVIPISGPYALGPSAFGEVFGADRKARRDASPIFHVKDLPAKDIPEFLVLVADRDMASLPMSARLFNAALEREGVRSSLAIIPDRDHGSIVIRIPRPGDPVAERIITFVQGGRQVSRARPQNLRPRP